MAYDRDNAFAQILDGRLPCFRVHETEHALAFLDLFPATPGHTLVIPKHTGAPTIMDLPPDACASFCRELPLVARAVKSAMKADGITLLQNNLRAGGQEVFHPHVHVVPRYENVPNPFQGKRGGARPEKLSAEAAAPVVAAIVDAIAADQGSAANL